MIVRFVSKTINDRATQQFSSRKHADSAQPSPTSFVKKLHVQVDSYMHMFMEKIKKYQSTQTEKIPNQTTQLRKEMDTAEQIIRDINLKKQSPTYIVLDNRDMVNSSENFFRKCSGHLRRPYGMTECNDTAPGKFTEVSKLTKDDYDIILIAKNGNERIQIFTYDGKVHAGLNLDECIEHLSHLHPSSDGKLNTFMFIKEGLKVLHIQAP